MSDFPVDIVNTALLKLIRNEPVSELEVPPELDDFMELVTYLEKMHQEQKEFAMQLSRGELDAKLPARTNHLADGLKQLHAQMRHLTWQAQCVAKGDYQQRVDFMGNFSAAFNNMVALLSEREDKLKAQHSAMNMIFDKIEAGIAVVCEDEVIYQNDALRRQHPDLSFFSEEAAKMPPDNKEHIIKDEKNGRWFSLTNCSIVWNNSENARLFFSLDITANMEREAKLQEAAHTDELTGIENRSGLNHALTILWDEGVHSHRPLSLLMFDIDFFKVVNDTYGHPQGDICLKAFADILKRSVVRSGDVVARYGGEEFVVLLPNANKEGAIKVAEEIRMEVEKLVIQATGAMGNDKAKEIRFTVSCGVSTAVPSNNYYPSQFLNSADNALYQAKETGRNRVCYQDVFNY